MFGHQTTQNDGGVKTQLQDVTRRCKWIQHPHNGHAHNDKTIIIHTINWRKQYSNQSGQPRDL